MTTTPETLTLRCDACMGKRVVPVYSDGRSALPSSTILYHTTCGKCGGTGVYKPTINDLREIVRRP